MSNDLYIRMVRNRPRRKGQPPGEWEPFFHARVHDYPSREEAIEAEGCGIDVWNKRERRQEHALFRVPAAATERVYPAAAKGDAR